MLKCPVDLRCWNLECDRVAISVIVTKCDGIMPVGIFLNSYASEKEAFIKENGDFVMLFIQGFHGALKTLHPSIFYR